MINLLDTYLFYQLQKYTIMISNCKLLEDLKE